MILLFVFMVLFFFLTENKLSLMQKNLVFIFLLVFWWFLESFRWESGTDFYIYYSNFSNIKESTIETNRFELGYNLLIIFFRDYMHLSFYTFSAVYYAIVFLLYYFSIKKASPDSILFIFIFFCLSIGLMGSTRQLMALSIMFFATVYFLEHKKLWFILFVFLASMFHRTIIVCLIYIIFTNNIRYKYWLYLIGFAVFAQLSGMNSLLSEKVILLLPKAFSERYLGYLSIAHQNSISVIVFISGICRRILPVVLFFLYRDVLNRSVKTNHLEFILNVLFFSLFAYIILSFDFTFIISRISIYFIIFEVFFYSILITIFVKEKKYTYVSALFILFFILAYKGIINYPELFLPYKTIFFTF